MELTATYRDGRLVFDAPVRLKHKSFPVRVSIPDEAVDLAAQTEKPSRDPLDAVESEALRSLVRRMRQIRGRSAGYRDDGRTDAERFAEEVELYYR